MKSDHETPSIIWIIWTDYYAFISAFIPLCIWAVVLFLWNGQLFIELGALGTVIVSGVVAWRVLLLRKVFREGKTVPGRITSAYLVRDRGRVEYTYAYQGKYYKSGVSIHRNRRTKALREGIGVILMVDARKPERAFIRSLYLDQ